MKDKYIKLKPTRTYSSASQCDGKKPYKLKRRAIKQADKYAADTGFIFVAYECPHCGFYHIGKKHGFKHQKKVNCDVPVKQTDPTNPESTGTAQASEDPVLDESPGRE